jgi:hypothetical protein
MKRRNDMTFWGNFVVLFVIVFSIIFLLSNIGRESSEEIYTSKIIDDLVDATLTITSAAHEKPSFTYKITNNTSASLTLEFPTSQQYEYVVRDEQGNVVEKYSDGKMFLQVLKKITIQPNEYLSYEIELQKEMKGKYSLEIWLKAKGTNNYKRMIQFAVK